VKCREKRQTDRQNHEWQNHEEQDQDGQLPFAMILSPMILSAFRADYWPLTADRFQGTGEPAGVSRRICKRRTPAANAG
jgi:hypothetical protein